MKPRVRWAAGGAGVLAVAAAGWALWPGGGPAVAGPGAGAALGGAAITAVASAPGWRQPARCTERPEGEPLVELVVGQRHWTWGDGGARLEADGSGRRLRLGVIADARVGAGGGPRADERTLASARQVRDQLREAGAEVVLSLGGLGDTREAIEAVLGVFATTDAGWLVVALPGDREPLAAHREAVAALRARGAPIVDGSTVRVLVAGAVAIGLVPGAAIDADGQAHALVAGGAGCGREPADLAAVARALGDHEGTRVLAAHAPPRQHGAVGTDLALGGVHVGEPALARLGRDVGATVFVHAEVDEAAGRAAGGRGAAEETGEITVIASGPLEAIAGPRGSGDMGGPGAIYVDIEGNRARVRPIHARP